MLRSRRGERSAFAVRPFRHRIDARSDYWDPATEPGERDHARALGAERRAALRAEAEAEADEELARFVGMEEARDEIDRLEASVLADKRRAAAGLPVKYRGLHLVLKGPPGVGKTSLARVIAKMLAAADVLPTDRFVEVGRGDLVAEVIGGSEAKILKILREIIAAGGGVLFINEAYLLTSSESKNDFGRCDRATVVVDNGRFPLGFRHPRSVDQGGIRHVGYLKSVGQPTDISAWASSATGHTLAIAICPVHPELLAVSLGRGG